MLSWDILLTEIRVGHPKLCLDRMIPMGVESTDAARVGFSRKPEGDRSIAQVLGYQISTNQWLDGRWGKRLYGFVTPKTTSFGGFGNEATTWTLWLKDGSPSFMKSLSSAQSPWHFASPAVMFLSQRAGRSLAQSLRKMLQHNDLTSGSSACHLEDPKAVLGTVWNKKLPF